MISFSFSANSLSDILATSDSLIFPAASFVSMLALLGLLTTDAAAFVFAFLTSLVKPLSILYKSITRTTEAGSSEFS